MPPTPDMEKAAQLKAEILRLGRDYAALAHRSHRPGDDIQRTAPAAFQPGQTPVPYIDVFIDDDIVHPNCAV